MTNSKEIITQLKLVREERGYSYGDIVNLVEENGSYVSKSSVQRIFAEGSEENSFDFEKTIKPIADVLLDVYGDEETDDLDTKAMKAMLRYKSQRIAELERQVKTLETDIVKVKLSNHEKLEAEREKHNKSIEFLKKQIELKDKRMDLLLDAVQAKDARYDQLNDKFTETLLNCPYKKETK